MHALDTNAPYQWIRTHVDTQHALRDPHMLGNAVAHCLPTNFAAFCKLLHPLYERLPDPSLPPGFVGLPKRGKRVRWHDLATQAGRAIHPEMSFYSFAPWPDAVIDPDEGSLDQMSVDRLTQCLTPWTGTQRCYFHYDLIATQRREHDLLFMGPLDAVRTTLPLEDVFGSPTYWWPSDHTWCVYTSWDLTFTLVGGPDTLITTLLTDAELECIRVHPQMRVDYQADQER